MSQTTGLRSWFASFDGHQQIFAAGGVEKTISYLRDARTPEQGWGPYPRMGSDVHHSSLVVQALLHWSDPSASHTIADAADVASYLRKTAGSEPQGLSLDEISDLLTTAQCEQRPDDEEYLKRLTEALTLSYSNLVLGGGRPTVRSACSAMLAILGLNAPNLMLIQPWIERLISLQLPDGGWPATEGEPSSLMPTGMAVRVFARLNTDPAREALGRGLHFLRSRLEENGSGRFDSKLDLLTQATVLWAFVAAPVSDYSRLRDQIDNLLRRMNRDGSWGVRPGESGNVEATALCLLVLAWAGENRFVPAQLATAALSDAANQLAKATGERDKLVEDFEKRVRSAAGNVVAERNTLLNENRNLKAQNESLQRALHEAQQTQETIELQRLRMEREIALERSREWSVERSGVLPRIWRSLSRTITIVVIVQIVALALALYSSLRKIVPAFVDPRWYSWIALGLGFTSVLAVVFLAYFFQRTALRREDQIYFPPEAYQRMPSSLSALRSIYFEFSASWPRAVREEMAYRLLDLLEASPDVGYRVGEDLAARLGVRPEERQQFLVWLRNFLHLPPSARRVLLEQISTVSIR